MSSLAVTQNKTAPQTRTPIAAATTGRRITRTSPLLAQVINTIMHDGKKARAERMVADALFEVRRQTKNDPHVILREAIERVSPLIKIQNKRKNAKVTQVPVPLNERQQRRCAITWILDASDKRADKEFAMRFASELLAVVNGNSAALQRRDQVHKSAIANRANLPVKW